MINVFLRIGINLSEEGRIGVFLVFMRRIRRGGDCFWGVILEVLEGLDF